MKPTGTKFKLHGKQWEIYYADLVTKEYKCKTQSKKGKIELRTFKESELEGAEFY